MGAPNEIGSRAGFTRARHSGRIELTIIMSKSPCSRNVKGVRKSSDREPLIEIKSAILNNPRSIIFFLYVDLLFTRL